MVYPQDQEVGDMLRRRTKVELRSDCREIFDVHKKKTLLKKIDRKLKHLYKHSNILKDFRKLRLKKVAELNAAAATHPRPAQPA